MNKLALVVVIVVIGGKIPSSYSLQDNGAPPNANCPFGVCLGASIETFRTTESPQQVCNGRMCLVSSVPNPIEPFTEYSVAFTDEGKACGVIASYQAESESEVLEKWTYVAAVYSLKYGYDRAFDETTMTTVWSQFKTSIAENINRVTLTIGQHDGVYLLTDITTFDNIDQCR